MLLFPIKRLCMWVLDHYGLPPTLHDEIHSYADPAVLSVPTLRALKCVWWAVRVGEPYTRR